MAAEPVENKKPATDNNFDKRHEKELGIGRFITVSGMNLLIPLGSAAAAGVLGYLTLGKPIKAAFPRLLKWGSDIPELAKAALNFDITRINEVGPKVFATATKTIDEIRKTDPHFKVTSGVNLARVIRESSKFPEETAEIRNLLGMAEPDLLKNAKYVGAGVGAFLGSMFGGMAVNYNEWRKDESARLAAEEVNKNISQMEIFKPSDPEIVAENKRLRAMLATPGGITAEQALAAAGAELVERDRPQRLAGLHLVGDRQNRRSFLRRSGLAIHVEAREIHAPHIAVAWWQGATIGLGEPLHAAPRDRDLGRGAAQFQRTSC